MSVIKKCVNRLPQNQLPTKLENPTGKGVDSTAAASIPDRIGIYVYGYRLATAIERWNQIALSTRDLAGIRHSSLSVSKYHLGR